MLSIVKEHSNLLRKTVVDISQDTFDVEVDQKFWHDVLDSYFIGGRESKEQQDDDLLFFVREMVFCLNFMQQKENTNSIICP